MAEPGCHEQFLRTDLQAMPISKTHRKAEGVSLNRLSSSQYQAWQRSVTVMPPRLHGI